MSHFVKNGKLMAVPDPGGGGGQKGHMPPEAATRHTLPPEKS